MEAVLVYLQAFRRNSLSKCALQPKIAKNSLKIHLLGVQGRSRSSMLINLKTLSPVLVMISSMSVPIYNCFHTKWANSGNMTSFGGTPSFEGNPLTLGHNILSQKTSPWGKPQWRFRYPSLHHFDTDPERDEQTHRQTDAQTMVKMREAFCYRA